MEKQYTSMTPYQKKVPTSTDESAPGNTPTSMPIPADPMSYLAMAATDLVKVAIHEISAYNQCLSREITERKRIAAQLSAIKMSLDVQREAVMQTINNNHQLRMTLLNEIFKAQKIALETHDTEVLKQMYAFALDMFDKTSNNIQFPDSFMQF